jgi:hypothetical protein
MMNRENTSKNIFWLYYNIKSSLENDLRNIHLDTKNALSEDFYEMALRLQLSLEKNQKLIEESVDELYLTIKNAFENIFYCNKRNSTTKDNEKISYALINSKFTTRDSKYFETEDAIIVEDHIQNNKMKLNAKETISKLNINAKDYDNRETRMQKYNYTSLINDVMSKSGAVICNIAQVMMGKLCNSYGVKDRQPKRLWKWEDRIDYLQGYLKENKLTNAEQIQIRELRTALQKNYYLKSKRKEYYKKIDDCLSQYCS